MEVLSSAISFIDGESEKSLKHPETIRISNAVENFVFALQTGVEKLNSLYEGPIICAGSFFDDLKIDGPNEFDFNIELQNFVYGKNYILQHSGFKGTRNLWRTSSKENIYKKIHLIDRKFAEKWHGNDKTINVGTKQSPEYILSPIDVKNEFHELIQGVLKTIVTPKYLSVIGVVDLSGPAISIDLKWDGRYCKDLTVNVDVSLAIPVPAEASPFNPLNLFPKDHPLYYAVEEYIEQKHSYAAVPYVSGSKKLQNCWRLSTGYLESFLFQAFKRNSNVKMLLRFLKYERETLIKSFEFFPTESLERPTGERVSVDSKSPFGSITLGVPIFKELEEFRSASMKNISSYGIKQMVLYMMRDTKPSSIGQKYIDFLNFWHRASKKGFINNFFLPENKIIVGSFEDCFESFAAIFSWIRNVLDYNEVPMDQQMDVWNQLHNIQRDLLPMFDENDLEDVCY